MMHGFGYGMWGWGFVGMLLFWVGGIILVVWIAKGAFSSRRESNSLAKDILDERFARGDINADEYKAMKKEITK